MAWKNKYVYWLSTLLKGRKHSNNSLKTLLALINMTVKYIILKMSSWWEVLIYGFQKCTCSFLATFEWLGLIIVRNQRIWQPRTTSVLKKISKGKSLSWGLWILWVFLLVMGVWETFFPLLPKGESDSSACAKIWIWINDFFLFLKKVPQSVLPLSHPTKNKLLPVVWKQILC